MATRTEKAQAEAQRRPWRAGAWLLGLLMLAGAAVVVWLWLARAGGEVLVVVPDGVPDGVAAGDTVRVTGEVAEYDFDPAWGEREDFEDWEDDNLVVAESVSAVDSVEPGLDELEDAVEGDRVGDRIVVVGEVEELVGERAFSVVEP